MASNTSTIKVPMRDVTQGITLKLKMPRTLSLRMKIGAWLIGLAGRIMHMPCEVDIVRKADAKDQ